MPALISLPTTGAIVECHSPRFQDNGIDDQNTITMSMNVYFNGMAGTGGLEVQFARNATDAQKQAAVKAKVNELLHGIEPNVTLNNANIQVNGLPV